MNLLNSESVRHKTGDEEQTTEDSEHSSALRPASSVRQNAVLNLGDSCVSIAIADPGGRPFVRDIGTSVAGDARPSLAAGRGAPHGSFSIGDGWSAHSNHQPATNDSLVEDVTTTLRYYAAQEGSARVDRLLVCGGSAAAEESVELLRTRLNIEVEPWNPPTDGGFRMEDRGLKETNDDSPPSAICNLQRYGPSLAVATGLAMRSV